MQRAASPASVALQLKALPLDRRIVIVAGRGGRARVLVEPRLDLEPGPESFQTLAAAQSFAAGISLARGWPVVDPGRE